MYRLGQWICYVKNICIRLIFILYRWFICYTLLACLCILLHHRNIRQIYVQSLTREAWGVFTYWHQYMFLNEHVEKSFVIYKVWNAARLSLITRYCSVTLNKYKVNINKNKHPRLTFMLSEVYSLIQKNVPLWQ
jgi:hypothetical protein